MQAVQLPSLLYCKFRGARINLNYDQDINSFTNRTQKAKLIKKALKEKYPDVKFSVTVESYSQGWTFNINWTNSVPYSEIDKLLEQFRKKDDMFFVSANREITPEVWKFAEKQIEAINKKPYNDYSSDHTTRLTIVSNTDFRGIF